jgi:hypothetical protein
MQDAQNTEFRMQEALTAQLKTLRGTKEFRKGLNKEIPNDWWKDTRDGSLLRLTKENLINVAFNMGNKTSREAMLRWAGKDKAARAEFETKLRGMLEEHLTDADWQYVENILGISEPWQKAAADMYYLDNAKPPKWIEAEPYVAEDGTTKMKGGYFPLIYDAWRSTIQNTKDREGLTEKSLFGPRYSRATVANHYAKDRVTNDHIS